QHESAFSVLGGGGIEPRQCALRIFRAARILAAGAAREERLAHGKSSGVTEASERKSRTRRACRGDDALLSGAQLATFDVGALHRIPLRVEPPGRWAFPGRGRCLRGAGFRNNGRPVCKTLWRTAQPFVG